MIVNLIRRFRSQILRHERAIADRLQDFVKIQNGSFVYSDLSVEDHSRKALPQASIKRWHDLAASSSVPKQMTVASTSDRQVSHRFVEPASIHVPWCHRSAHNDGEVVS